MIILAQSNLNFGRSAKVQQSDVDKMFKRASIVVTQEDVRGKHRERVLVARGVQVDGKGALLSALARFGMAIGWRRFAWKDVDLDGIGMVRVFSVHMPPLRMRGVLYPIYAARLRRALRRSPHPWLAGGDWNWLVSADPAGLRKAFDSRWCGQRIDGWAIHRDLVKHVAKFWTRQDPHRGDQHPVVYLALRARIDLKENR